MFTLPCLIPVIALTFADASFLPDSPPPPRAPSQSDLSLKGNTSFSLPSAPAQFDLSLKLDAPLLGASAIMWGASILVARGHSGPVATGAGSGVWSVDRIALGRTSASQALGSDVIRDALLIGVPLGLTVANWDGSSRSLLPAFLVGESIFASFAINELTKSFVNRPRPYTYAQGIASGDGRRSFYSGHTTVAFAAVTSGAYLLHELYPDSSAPLWLGALGLLGAASVGVLRVTSGKHFPSDVAVGAAAGVGIGWAVPWLHKRRRNWGLTIGVNQIGVAGTF